MKTHVQSLHFVVYLHHNFGKIHFFLTENPLQHWQLRNFAGSVIGRVPLFAVL